MTGQLFPPSGNKETVTRWISFFPGKGSFVFLPLDSLRKTRLCLNVAFLTHKKMDLNFWQYFFFVFLGGGYNYEIFLMFFIWAHFQWIPSFHNHLIIQLLLLNCFFKMCIFPGEPLCQIPFPLLSDEFQCIHNKFSSSLLWFDRFSSQTLNIAHLNLF